MRIFLISLCGACVFLGTLFVPALKADDGPITAEGVWVAESLGTNPNTAAYMVLRNTGDKPDTLIAAESAAAERVELHTHEMEDGVMRMRKLDGVFLPAGEAAEFKPGGLHIMIFGVKEPLKPGADIPLILYFKEAGPMTLNAPVRKRIAQAGHGGHKAKGGHGGHKKMGH